MVENNLGELIALLSYSCFSRVGTWMAVQCLLECHIHCSLYI